MDKNEIKKIFPQLENKKVKESLINLRDYLIVVANVYEESLAKSFCFDKKISTGHAG